MSVSRPCSKSSAFWCSSMACSRSPLDQLPCASCCSAPRSWAQRSASASSGLTCTWASSALMACASCWRAWSRCAVAAASPDSAMLVYERCWCSACATAVMRSTTATPCSSSNASWRCCHWPLMSMAPTTSSGSSSVAAMPSIFSVMGMRRIRAIPGASRRGEGGAELMGWHLTGRNRPADRRMSMPRVYPSQRNAARMRSITWL